MESESDVVGNQSADIIGGKDFSCIGADWLDRLELMIVIEDQFADVLVTDEEVDQLEVVGDLIRHIENTDHERRRRSIVEATPLQ
jgi:acyl carrier protein